MKKIIGIGIVLTLVLTTIPMVNATLTTNEIKNKVEKEIKSLQDDEYSNLCYIVMIITLINCFLQRPVAFNMWILISAEVCRAGADTIYQQCLFCFSVQK